MTFLHYFVLLCPSAEPWPSHLVPTVFCLNNSHEFGVSNWRRTFKSWFAFGERSDESGVQYVGHLLA